MLIPFSAAFYIGDVPLHHEYTILLSPLPLTESLRVMKSIQSKKAVLAHFIWHHNFFSHFFVTISDSEGLHHFFFFFCWNAPCLDYICNRQEPKWSCSTAGSTRLFIWWGKEDPKKTQTPEFAFVASHQQRRCSKGASTWQIPLKSPLFFLSFCPPQSWHGCWPSHSPSETFHHRSLTADKRLVGFSQVFLTRPVPESHSADGRLQPFVTLPVRAWLRMTGDGCVKKLSNPTQKKGKMTERKVPNKECFFLIQWPTLVQTSDFDRVWFPVCFYHERSSESQFYMKNTNMALSLEILKLILRLWWQSVAFLCKNSKNMGSNM